MIFEISLPDHLSLKQAHEQGSSNQLFSLIQHKNSQQIPGICGELNLQDRNENKWEILGQEGPALWHSRLIFCLWCQHPKWVSV